MKPAGYRPSLYLACLEDNGPSGNIVEAQQGKRVGWAESLSLSVKHPLLWKAVGLMGLPDGRAVPAVCCVPSSAGQTASVTAVFKGDVYCVSMWRGLPVEGRTPPRSCVSLCRPRKPAQVFG